MKKFFGIFSLVLMLAIFSVLGLFIFRKSKIDSVEIVGDVQKIYFVGSANAVNFNDAKLKITYKDGSEKFQTLSNDFVKVTNFKTSNECKDTMKITYKFETIDVEYAVIKPGLYFLERTEKNIYDDSYLYKSRPCVMTAGVNNKNIDCTTTIEMVNFYTDGTCDYYSRKSRFDNWIMDDGSFDKTFNFKFMGNTIKLQLGSDITYDLTVDFSDENVKLSCFCYENYNESKSIKTVTEKCFKHYEMKNNRAFENNITISSDAEEIKYKIGEAFSDRDYDIYLVINCVNDNFLKKVYVRFNEAMFKTSGEFDTSVITPSETRAACYYEDTYFYLSYSVME